MPSWATPGTRLCSRISIQPCLKALGVRNYDCAIVAVGDDVGNSALITLNLKEIGVKEVIAKAQSHVHRKVLEKIGADRVVFPEHEMGVKLAQGLSSSNVLNFIELSDDYGIVELAAPRSWVGHTLKELDVRAKYGVNIIAIRDGASRAGWRWLRGRITPCAPATLWSHWGGTRTSTGSMTSEGDDHGTDHEPKE